MKEAVVIVVTKNSKFYFSKRLDSRKPFFEFWQCPGGSVEQGEKYKEAACRELFEEMGLNVNPSDLNLISKKIRSYKNGVKYRAINFHLNLGEYETPVRTEPDKSSDWKQFTIEEVHNLTLIPGISQICNIVDNLVPTS